MCVTCEMIEARHDGGRPDWDDIVRTEHWGVLHAFDSRHLGWLIMVTQQHRAAWADLTDAEVDEFGRLSRAVSQALGHVTGCPKTYLSLFAENPEHPHVHVHLVARTADMPDNRRGPMAFAMLGADDDERVSETAMNELALAIRANPAMAAWS